jgi:carbon-monoxide dehydrogenase small subunit
MSLHRIQFQLNGKTRSLEVPAQQMLIELLREDLALTGTKEGCSVGVCGACSVTINGDVVSACLVPAVFVDGTSVGTIEGIAEADGRLAPLQLAFIEHGGFQCGICTPGQIVAADALLRDSPSPSDGEIREWMMGNLCRCTGYEGIVRAIRAASGVHS